MIKLLKTLQKTFAIITGVMAVYALIFQNFEVIPYMMLSQGVMLLAIGLNEMNEERKKAGVVVIIASLFVFFVGIYTF
ncbi:DUF3953 domain-containing protein [Alkalibacterium putridalgicola]|uniref:DUF3953 domain-containing protein n=1 Tax=Alkalibacterium putridalgicola TaxID=426703 RepID=UPI0034CF4469